MKRKQSRGLWLAFFGPDGVGKSAVIEQLARQLEPGFESTLRFHFRPGFCSDGRRRPPVTEPHGKPARSMPASMLKLIYWLADCWFGYLAVILSSRRRGRLVIFDRYVPDMVVDPVRYRLPSRALRFSRWLITLAPQPDLHVLLDAPAEAVHLRKSELPLAELRRQRAAYLKMFQSLRCKLIVNADASIREVADNIAVALAAVRPNSLTREPSHLASLFVDRANF